MSYDNPGWSLKIDLKDTLLEDQAFAKGTYGEMSQDLDEWKRTGSWWIAEVKDGVFDAACGSLDLAALVSVFREWAEREAKA
ncbi:MAG TPA: Imm53 family immunity protein [Caulobacteraceae bacterium]|jgi:hypothetical protein|nr:Imm53 family immunity protein [Caulobacteraceae bacterium]